MRSDVDADRWQTLKALFEEAPEQEPNERGTFLTEACAGNPALQGEVQSLLRAHEEDGPIGR